MAKFTRHDSRNKKMNRKKRMTSEGFDFNDGRARPRGNEFEEKRISKYRSFRDFYNEDAE